MEILPCIGSNGPEKLIEYLEQLMKYLISMEVQQGIFHLLSYNDVFRKKKLFIMFSNSILKK